MIEIKNLTKSYSGRNVLDGVNAVIRDGETFSVIGPSGCGKSTFLKCIIRLIKPEAGEILVDGKSVADIENEFELAKLRRNFGYLFQGGALFDSLTVMENVTFGLKHLTDIPRSEYTRIAREKLALVDLKDAENLKPAELSGGMKKRAALARAIATEPKYILYDEPTTGLDPITCEMVQGLITDMAAKLRITSVVVTHDIRLAFTISNRIAMLFNGNFDVTGAPDELRVSKNPAVIKFTEEALSPDAHSRKNGFNGKA
ncbi:MAG: ATP-binding cassette domain-containing protein, partial [Elusimicrobia bacterium]|nr:ATP-binding cassette domain-containing protein [Elusimicrobiota bacterium]